MNQLPMKKDGFSIVQDHKDHFRFLFENSHTNAEKDQRSDDEVNKPKRSCYITNPLSPQQARILRSFPVLCKINKDLNKNWMQKTCLLSYFLYILYTNSSCKFFFIQKHKFANFDFPIDSTNNQFVTSKNETTNSPIHQFLDLKCSKMSLKCKSKAQNVF